MEHLDAWLAALMAPLGVWILISGLDDLFVLLAFLRPTREEPPPDPYSEKRMAIFVPCWKEEAVIQEMVRRNREAIRYRAYDFFIGVYPNDLATRKEVEELERLYPDVHLALCPHDGPTSKADCLNAIYRRMCLHELSRGIRFDVVVTHDAEDLIHPESLSSINAEAERFGMIQVPVLPLASGFSRLTHGIYCDEFAEYQTKDIPAREMLGGFVPSNGVGTGYTRGALALLAGEDGELFDPECLTEDYDSGLRLHLLGCRQHFVPLRFAGSQPVATREFFPKTIRQAVRQRTRWVIGISLQSWERHGWSCGWRQIYWFWRDRKGLLGNPVSLLTNLVFIYGVISYAESRLAGMPWGLGELMSGRLAPLLPAILALQTLHLSVRAACCGRIYGWLFALGVPLRAVWGNWINCAATVHAFWLYLQSRLTGRRLRWLKTAHEYPAPTWLPAPALSRMLPAAVLEKWCARPLRVGDGKLYVSVPPNHGRRARAALQRYTRLEVVLRPDAEA